jgi:two-component system OmpR family sensor kinase
VRRVPRWAWWLAAAALPGLLAAGLATAMTVTLQPLPIVRALIDVATLVLATGLAASGVLLALAGAAAWAERRERHAATTARQAATAEAARDRRRFLQRLDHELKNPLTAIQAGLALMPRGAPAGAEGADGQGSALASVEAQVRRISRLTADLRKLAELESRPLERGPVDVADLLRQVVDLAQERSGVQGGRRLTLTLPQAPWPLPPVPGDYDLLLLVAHNLVDNALKYSRPGDTLEVRASEDGNWVVVEVADTGPGIPAAELPHVWEELYRGQGARGQPGSGLGLALAQAIVQRHGGQMALRSREGQGTVVQVRLPVTNR